MRVGKKFRTTTTAQCLKTKKQNRAHLFDSLVGKGEHSQDDKNRGDGHQDLIHAVALSCQVALPREPSALTI